MIKHLARRSALLLVAGLLVGSAGCSLALPPRDAPPSATNSPPAPVGPSAPVSPGPLPDDPTGSPGADVNQLGPVVATKTLVDAGTELTLRLYPIRRADRLAHLRLTLTADERYQISALLSDRNRDSGEASGDAADGITLVDPKRSKVYLVASDGQGQCLCSRGLFTTFLTGGEPELITATFAAPPAGVDALEVHVPRFGVFRAVPVQ